MKSCKSSHPSETPTLSAQPWTTTTKRKDYKPNEALYTLVVNKLAQARLFDAIDNVMARIKSESKCRLSDNFFRTVIKAYGNVGGLINKAIETLYDMPNMVAGLL
ncbi:pentatricopeptide repeat-containing protein [Prunus yedoensis var. nudiflora]|uniref:Pentatricopeptide repeat-containing protein n=1 Tax=Prunus yedoensis var. nudiflora TaxID=2094558 RepID=A0A314XNP3_PRUYE|nr:pentatricopeptide repeat-containing protein [Prunus yedoensis var. nudiflora]